MTHLSVVPNSEPPDPGGLSADSPPTWLGREGKAEWRRVVKYLKERDPGRLEETDRAILAAYCNEWDTYVTASGDVKARGSLIPGRSSAEKARGEGGMVKNPSVQIARDALTHLRALAKELGLTPAARGAVRGARPAGARGAARLLNS